MAAEPLKHGVKGNVAKIGGVMRAVFKQPLLLLGDTVKAPIIVDDNGDRPVFLKGRLDRQAARQKSTITADQNDIAVLMNVLGRDRKGHANTKQAEGARMQDAAKFAAIEAGKIDGNFRPEMGYVIKKKDFYNFETDLKKKFEHLIEIENFGNKL